MTRAQLGLAIIAVLLSVCITRCSLVVSRHYGISFSAGSSERAASTTSCPHLDDLRRDIDPASRIELDRWAKRNCR